MFGSASVLPIVIRVMSVLVGCLLPMYMGFIHQTLNC